VLIRDIVPRIGCQFSPSVEYANTAVVSRVPALPPATNTPFPNAMALHLVRIANDPGTSLQLIPSYENTSEFVVSPPATQTPFPTPDAAVSAALLVLGVCSAMGAYAMVRTLVIIVLALAIAVHRIPFWENARQLMPLEAVPPATQMRPFGDIAVLVCPYLTARTVPDDPKTSFAPMACDHVFPSMVYVMGDTLVVLAAALAPPATAIACCCGC
jgi:hypothetical protein